MRHRRRRERDVSGDQRRGAGRVGGGGENRVEAPKLGVRSEQAKTLAHVRLLNHQQWRQELKVVAGNVSGVGAGPPSGPHVGELLDDLYRGARDDLPVGYRPHQCLTGFTERVLGTHRVDQNRGVQDDQPRRPRSSSSSARSSSGAPTETAGAARMRSAAAARRRGAAGRPRSIASRMTAATDVCLRLASAVTRSYRSSSRSS